MTKSESSFVEEGDGDDSVIGRALLRSAAVFVGVALIAGGAYFFLMQKPKPTPAIAQAPVIPVQRSFEVRPPYVLWSDITESAGIDFKHVNGAKGEKLLPETMGGGCAFFDYDNDNDQDLLLINSQPWPGNDAPEQPPALLAFYENDGKGNFTNKTKEVGLDVSVYGMGVACGDYDNDGLVDIFVSCLGKNRLFHNDGKKFTDVTESSGLAGSEKDWNTSCGWFDYDRDGDLDLMVCHYLQWTRQYDISQHFKLKGSTSDRAYGRPQNFGGTYPVLYRNEGHGKFTDVSEAAGIRIKNAATGVPVGKSLGIAFEDFDSDGYLDCVIANDTVQNFLFHNRRDGTFREIGIASGIGYDTAGSARGAMGIDIAAFRNDKSLGVAIGNFSNEPTALYVSKGDMQFNDVAVANGLGPASRTELKFAVLFLDYDLDGRLDLFQANGHLEEDISKVIASERYEQPPQLFWNAGPERKNYEFLLCKESETGPNLPAPMVGRGAAYADIDNDGDLDLIVVGCGQKPRLLRNDQDLSNHWLRVKLVAKSGNRDAIGAHIELKAGSMVQTRMVSPTRGYLSQVELPVTFGLGTKDKIDSLTIVWPNGQTTEVKEPRVDQLLRIEQ